MTASRGAIFYNRGCKMIVRLAVSAHSLRKHYDGPAAILSQGDESARPCSEIAKRYGLELSRVEYPQTPQAKNDVFINATLCHTKTPYDVSMWLDSDSTVHGDIMPMLDAAEEHEFAIAQFTNWNTHGRIAGRIRGWKGIHPDEWIQAAIDYGPAINCGVFAFRKDSKLMADWWSLAVKGQHTMIPDEVCCQLILPRYPHKMMPPIFNVSCKYGLPEHFADARVIHYHGRKHCRIEKGKVRYHAERWYLEFDEVRDWSVVREHIEYDRQLRHYVKRWDAMDEDTQAAWLFGKAAAAPSPGSEESEGE